MIILDTNVVSELSKPHGSAKVLDWVEKWPPGTLYLTSVSIAEMLSGLATLPEGKRKDALRTDIAQTIRRFGTPILAFDEEAATKLAELVVIAKANRYTLPLADGFIAAIAATYSFAVATRDVEPFQAAGVAEINPWEE